MARRRRIEDRMLLVAGETVQSRIGTYTINSVIGSGSYSTVYSANDNLGRKVALKEYIPARHPRELPLLKGLFERERFVLSLVSPHPLMPGFYDGFETDNHFYLAQEYIEGKTLDELISKTRLNNDWMLRWATSMCYALSYLHGLQIVHHDLKPSNIKIRPNGRLALLDFGAARYFGTGRSDVPESFLDDDELYGTEGYLPPELDSEGSFSADIRTDIFALGCILYEMVTGVPPEQGLINERLSIINTPLLSRKDINLEYLKLVTTALSYNTDYRYGNVQVFLDALKPISPPVFMISTKQLAFGRVSASGGPVQRKFSIFNGGCGGDFTGDVKPKSPWLSVDMPHLRGARRSIIVTADPSKTKERNKIVRGEIEVWVAEMHDNQNKVISASEKLNIECTILVTPGSARLEIAQEPSDGDSSYVLRVRKGTAATLAIGVRNAGESSTKVNVSLPNTSGFTVEPSSYFASPGEIQQLVVSAPAATDIKSDLPMTLMVKPQSGNLLEIPLVARPSSIADGLRGLFKR